MSNIRMTPFCLNANCVSCRSGQCVALTDNDFHGRPCPFYTTREMEDEAMRHRKERLSHLSKYERNRLLDMYYKKKN